MTTIGVSSLYSGTINGLNSLDLDTLNVEDLDVNNIDGDFFSINTIECNDLQIDNELDLTATGFIKIGKGTINEITITDTELGYLDAISSNIQDQLNTLSTDLNTAETDIDDLETLTQNVERSDVRLLIKQTTDIKDAFVDDTITNVISSFTHFDKNIIFSRTSSAVYREFFLGMTGDDTNPTNRFAIACNDGVGSAEPEILFEMDETGEISMRNGLKIYDILGNNVGTINNFSDTTNPVNSTFSIQTTTGNLFLSTPSIIDCWSPEIRLGQAGGSKITMRSDTANAYKSRIVFDNLTLFGGLANVGNDASIELNGETQNNAYTDSDHTEVAKIPTIENDVATNTSAISTNTSAIATNTSDITSINTTLGTLSPIPSGSVQAFAGNSLPSGWLWCNGAEVSQTTYSNLYSAIGTIYSTNRKTAPSTGNFFLPDLRGCYIAGAGQPQATSFNFKITPASKSVGQFREMSVQDHKHTMIVHDGTINVQKTGTNTTGVSNDADTEKSTAGLNYGDGSAFTSNTYINAGETQPFNICMNYIIKY